MSKLIPLFRSLLLILSASIMFFAITATVKSFTREAHGAEAVSQDIPRKGDLMFVLYTTQHARASVLERGQHKSPNGIQISAIVLLQYNPEILNPNDPQLASAGRVQVDCVTHDVTVVTSYALDKDGAVIREETESEKDLGKVKSESVGGKVLEFLCSAQKAGKYDDGTSTQDQTGKDGSQQT